MTFRWPWRHLGRHHNSVCVLSGISMETMARIWGWVFRWARGKVTHPCCDMVSFEGIQYIPVLLCIWIMGLSFALVTVTHVLQGYFPGILACGLGASKTTLTNMGNMNLQELGVVSLTFRELSKLFSRNLCIEEIVLLMRISSHALGTHTKFRLEILTLNVISSIVDFREIILESSRNFSETTPWLYNQNKAKQSTACALLCSGYICTAKLDYISWDILYLFHKAYHADQTLIRNRNQCILFEHLTNDYFLYNSKYSFSSDIPWHLYAYSVELCL